jgi:cyclohexa-1,5-dienecarbonyl-CoA hydratase
MWPQHEACRFTTPRDAPQFARCAREVTGLLGRGRAAWGHGSRTPGRYWGDSGSVQGAEGGAPALKAIVFEGAGAHFSYGVSVEEHRPGTVEEMLRAFHGLFRTLLTLDRVLIAVVRGQCLGGGLELASFCHRVFAHPGARLGQPEINLGVFPPVASVILPLRGGQAAADEICLTGRTFSARQALALRLVDEVAADPRRPSLHLEAHPAKERRLARPRGQGGAPGLRQKAGEGPGGDRASLSRDLMRTDDAKEGIEAFLAKRTPKWKDR